MGFWSRAGSRLLNMVRRRDDPIRYFQWIGLDAPAGIIITPQNALELSVVWACVMAITNGIAPSRWNVFAELGKRRQRLPDDALDYLLNVRPNPDMTAVSFRESLMIAVLTWGNGYAEITKNARGQPSELWPLLPDRVVPRRRPVKPYRLYYEYLQMDGSHLELEPEQVFHLRGPGITGLMGDNLVARAAKAMSLAAAQERFASTYFGNNTNLGGVLKTAKKLAPDAHARLKKDWEDQHKGPFKANRPTVLEDGMEWVPSNNDAEKAQLTGSRTFQVEEICFTPGVNVLTIAGPRPIESVAEGDLVLTHRGRWRAVRRVMSREYDGPVITAHAKGLSPVTATANHPFLVQTVKPSRDHVRVAVGDAHWVPASELLPSIAGSRRASHNLTMPRLEESAGVVDLKTWAPATAVIDGDAIRASDNHRATPVKRSPELNYSLGWLCGLFVADGSTSDHQAIFYIGAHEQEITAELRARLDSVFGASASTTVTPGNVARTVVSNRVLSAFFSQFGHVAHEKRLPAWCMAAAGAREFRAGLLAGLLAGDGCLSEGYALLGTTSRDLAWQMRLLLWADGLNGSMHRSEAGQYNIEGRVGAARERWTVQWRPNPVRRGSMGASEAQVFFRLHRAEQSHYRGTVHNLEVEEDESYVTVGGIVHNCRFYGVPPHKVQHLLRATFSNIEHLGIEFVRDALTPWARRNEQEADFKLFPKSGQRRTTSIDMAWLTHGDAKSRMEAHKIGRDMGVYSTNDILAMEGKDGIGPVGDMRIVPLNMTTDERMLEGPPDPAPVPPVSAPGGGGDGGSSSGGDGEGDAGTGTPGEDSGAFGNAIAREALVTVFASIFDRYEKRLENREADLRRGKHPGERIAAHLAEERERLRTVVLDESGPGLALLARGGAQQPDVALLLMLDEIDQGTDARAAAEKLVATCAARPIKPRA